MIVMTMKMIVVTMKMIVMTVMMMQWQCVGDSDDDGDDDEQIAFFFPAPDRHRITSWLAAFSVDRYTLNWKKCCHIFW